MQGNGCAFGNEARKEDAWLFKVGKRRSGSNRAEDGLCEAGRGCRKLLGARRKEHQAGGVEPLTQEFERK
jgi:hypothetical protein